MKRALIGGFLALLGTIWSLAVVVAASGNLVNAWGEYGRLLTTIIEMGLLPALCIAAAAVVFGVVVMLIEFFRKDS